MHWHMAYIMVPRNELRVILREVKGGMDAAETRAGESRHLSILGCGYFLQVAHGLASIFKLILGPKQQVRAMQFGEFATSQFGWSWLVRDSQLSAIFQIDSWAFSHNSCNARQAIVIY